MIFQAIPQMTGNEKKYLLECIDTNFVSTAGPFVTKFENAIAEASGAPEAVAVNSGTSALHLAFIAAGVSPGDLVICPNLTFIATTNAISYCHAEPWLFDVDDESWTLDADKLEIALKNSTRLENGKVIHKDSGKRISAIVAVYTMGCPANMDRIGSIAREFNIPLVADAAAAIGAKYKNRNLFSLADYTTFSFNGNKTITSGGGGAVIAQSGEKIKLIRHISTTARVGREYIHDFVGYNYRLTNVEAAIGLAQIEQLASFIKAKENIKCFYDDAFSQCSHFNTFPTPNWAQSTYWFSGIVLNENKVEKSDFVIDYLNKNGIESRSFWRPISNQRMYLNCPRESTLVTDNLWKRIITLPSSTGISLKDLNQVKRIILELDLLLCTI